MPPILIPLIQGDLGYDLNFTLTDAAGVVINLTGASIAFKAQLLSDPSVNFSGAGSIVSALAGTCKYTVQSTDFPVAGTYNAQVVATYSSSGEVITFPGDGYITIIVEARLPV